MKGKYSARDITQISFIACVVCMDFVVSANLLSRIQFERKNADCRARYNYKYYYDHGTEHCEQCREICQNAELTRTVSQCREECAQYLTAVQCKDKKDQYYDEVLDTCSSCASLCQNHQLNGNTRACREHCNAYLEKLTPKQVPSHHRQNYLKALDGSDSEEKSQTSDLLLHPGWIAAMAVGGVALVCVVVVVIVLYWTCIQQQRQQYGPAPQNDTAEGAANRENGPRSPVEETSQGSSGSQHFAIDGASAGLPTTVASVAFADLPVGRLREAVV